MTALLPTLTAARASLIAGRPDARTAQALGQIIAEIEKRTQAFTPLTTTEAHILDLVSQGYTNSEIAHRLQYADGTIRNFMVDILRKLGLSNRAEAAAFAITNNLSDYLRNRS